MAEVHHSKQIQKRSAKGEGTWENPEETRGTLPRASAQGRHIRGAHSPSEGMWPTCNVAHQGSSSGTRGPGLSRGWVLQPPCLAGTELRAPRREAGSAFTTAFIQSGHLELLLPPVLGKPPRNASSHLQPRTDLARE